MTLDDQLVVMKKRNLKNNRHNYFKTDFKNLKKPLKIKLNLPTGQFPFIIKQENLFFFLLLTFHKRATLLRLVKRQTLGKIYFAKH
jgi:hypothetical protein